MRIVTAEGDSAYASGSQMWSGKTAALMEYPMTRKMNPAWTVASSKDAGSSRAISSIFSAPVAA